MGFAAHAVSQIGPTKPAARFKSALPSKAAATMPLIEDR
jgi:hypothetical protein